MKIKCSGRVLSLLIALLISFLPCTSHAAGFPDEYYTKDYDASNGLASAEVNAITQTSDGYIWAGTYSGLYKFDGLKFSSALHDQKILSVMSLFSSSDGMLWIGTNDRGAARYDPKTQELTFYTTKDGLGSDSVRCICEDREGNVYLGTTNSLDRIDKNGSLQSFTDFSSNCYIRSICCNGDGIVTGVTNGGDAFFIKDDAPTLFTDRFGGAFLNSAGLGFDGHSFFATHENQVFDVDFSGEQPKVRLFAETGNTIGICMVKQLGSGDYCYLACDNGLGFLDRNGRFTDFNIQGFNSSVCDVIEDYQGNIWFASNKQGVVKISKNPFRNPLGKEDHTAHVVNAVCARGNTLLIGCDDGLIALDKDTLKPVYPSWLSQFNGIRIRNLMSDSDQNLWVSTYGNDGLVRISPSGSSLSFSEKSSNALGTRFRFAKELSDGTVLASASTGLTFIKDGKMLSSLSESDGLTTPQILDFVETPDGKVLAGSDGGGIFVIEDRKITGKIGAEQGLDSPVILKIVPCTGGYIYITSSSLYYDNGSKIKPLDSFPYSNCYDIHITENRQAWVSSSAGIFVLEEADMLADEPGYSYILLNEYRGLDTTLTANAWNYADPDDTFYLCGSNGVRSISVSDFNSVHEESSIKAYIRRVVSDGNEIFPDADGSYVIPSGTKRLTVYPAILNYRLSTPNVHIWLEGFDDTGVTYPQMEKTEVSFTNLPPGDYQLRMQILHEKNNALLGDITAPLTKESSFRESPWYTLLIMTLIVAFFAIVTGLIVRSRNLDVIKTQYKLIKDAKDEAERANQAKSFFLAKMSHDIRTPINSIMGMNEMIMQESSSKEILSYSHDIETSGKTLISLVDEILDLTKLESQKIELAEEEYNTADELREVFSTLKLRAENKNIKAIGDFDPMLPARLYGDSLKIKEVLLNLISNAVKYTENGSVTLKISVAEENDDSVKIAFLVKDTGTGISKENQDIIFNAFERLDSARQNLIEGTGLGLNISKKLLELMGSTLELNSTVGVGSEFSFVLTQKKIGNERLNIGLNTRPSASGVKNEVRYVNPKAQVLVVDDTPLNLKVVCNLLKKSEVQVDMAESGAECIVMAQRKRYDLILLDDMMPDMSGTETFNWLREKPNLCSKTPVVVLTANALVGAKEDYLRAGFDAYLSKPVNRATLEDILEVFIGGNQI